MKGVGRSRVGMLEVWCSRKDWSWLGEDCTKGSALVCDDHVLLKRSQ